MFGNGSGLFDSGNVLALNEPRVYELTGHAGALGIIVMVLGILLWAAIMTVLVLLAIDLVRRLRRRETPPVVWTIPEGADQAGAASTVPPAPLLGGPGGSEALRILDERYARGEMTHEEFLQRKGDLAGGPKE